MSSFDPLIYGPDGVLRTTVRFSTSLSSRFFEGTLAEDVVDVQVSINGSGFSSDPSLVQWGDGAWMVPNPESEPDGLVLVSGQNTIRLRTILPSGSVTAETSAIVTLISEAGVRVSAAIPTNISVEQRNQAVAIRAESSSDTSFRGMNFYASLDSGGGSSGYIKINLGLVSEGDTQTEETEFASLDMNSAVLVDGDDNPVADPLFFRITANQEGEDEVSLQEDLDTRFEVPETARTIRMVASITSIREFTRYEFSHDRQGTSSSSPPTIQVGAFSAIPTTTPLFYVVTAVYYDSVLNLEYESAYSEEVVGHPTTVTTSLGSFPVTSRQSIVQQFITAIFRSNPQVKVEAGSILRDTVIDPFSSESERLRFILDFYHRARTPTLLLQVDDPNGTGASVPVSQSPYKQGLQSALYLESSVEVQDLIDSCFEGYASNFGLGRRTGVSSVGIVTFYTTRRPTQTLLIPLGTTLSGGGQLFVTTRASAIAFERLASFYDPISGRYQVVVPVRALNAGSAGNIGTGQLSSIVSALSGSMSVVNTSPMRGGKDRESNLELTVRVQNTLSSVDSGTARGILKTAADVAGVVKTSVVSAGDSLMLRDLDSDGVHRGGKVDVWVQGSNIATVTDVFAFSFEISQDVQFEVIGDPSDLSFRAVDSTLSEENPIVELLDNPTEGFTFRNVTTGEEFDLTGNTITSYDTVQLSTDVVQPSVDLSDVVLGSYRKRTGNSFVLPRQPVSQIVSVTGTVSGALPEDSISLVHPDSPLVIGRSGLAGDYLLISSYLDEDGNQIPSGETISVTDEQHVLVGGYEEFLDTLGANYLSLRVYNEARTIEYKGPNDPSGDPDYTVNLGSQTRALSITRVETGDIASGATVSCDYSHDENFTVVYQVNLITTLTQDEIDSNKHVTADILVKEAIEIPLDLQATVVLIRGRDPSTVDTSIRTNLANFFNNLKLGDPVRQSDIIRIIEGTEGVSYVVVPLTTMIPQQGSTIVREAISTDTASESTLVDSLSTNSALVYLLNNSLEFATTDGGGPDGEFKGVTKDDVELTLLDASSSLNALGVSAGRAYIIGTQGISIMGVSDDATLIAQGYVTATAIQDRREVLTSNHILVSESIGSSPTEFFYHATYIVGADSGAKNVDPGSVQYVSAGDFLFTYDEDR